MLNAGQLVLAGDFFQLPPVGKKGSPRPTDYVFSAKSWNTCIPKPYFLQRVFRQKDDGILKLAPIFLSSHASVQTSFLYSRPCDSVL
jgi:hypothetical protein